ncbi:hypothetical protein BJX63DRAFT_400793 [Aspergillus granulosus]|uniref:Uncharacterized protein n=1 Tax=Aspergillus granulosus TaxID=176169 RepID=A0ABR4H5Z9_9EURO
MTLTTRPRTSIQKLSRTFYIINPHVLPPPLQLLSSSYQHRTLWYSYHEDDPRPRHKRARILYQHHHHPRCKHPRQTQKDQAENNKWDLWGVKRKWVEDWPLDRHWNSHWNSHSARARRRMEWIKKEVDADPYAAVFGRRHEPLHFPRLEEAFTTLWNSFLGLGSGFVKEDKSKTSSSTAGAMNKATSSNSDNIIYSPGEPQIRPNTVPPPSPDIIIREDGFEFDPISGRMVQRPSNVVEGNKKRESTGPEEDGLATLNFLKTNQKDSKRLNADAPEEQTTTLESTQKNPNSIPASPSVMYEAIRAETPQSENQARALASTANAESSIMSQNEIKHANRSIDVGNVIDPEPLVEYREQEQGLDRAGFLSRRGEDSPVSAPDLTQEQPLVDTGDINIELLRASDIRALYEPRRSSIRSELAAEEAEAGKCLDWSSASNATFAASSTPHSELLAEHSESTFISPEVSSASIDSSQANEQTRGRLSQDEVPAADANLSSESLPAEVYRVFAYDPSLLQVTEAETISSLRLSSEHLHPTEVLTRLANPAKFLPCLNKMRAEGYEIVSGGEDILVFRKAISTPKQNNQEQNSAVKSMNLGSIDTAPEQTATDVFTGDLHPHASEPQSQEEKPRSRTGSILRRMVISGAATAGTCYAIGVVVEYFRTGGDDGWGVDGFTVFESERRHREA